MKRNSLVDRAFQFVFRAFSGMAIIYFANIYLAQSDMMVCVGINLISFLTSGILGIPGVALLYGISFYQIL